MQPEAMNERSHLEESLHYLMINVLVDSLESQGFSVSADHVGGLRKPPAPVGGFIPDIEARRKNEVRLIEVRTESTLGLPETRDLLAGLAGERPGAVSLAVPFDCMDAAEELRLELDLSFTILPCYPFVGYVGLPK
jgi:hypothetical protein